MPWKPDDSARARKQAMAKNAESKISTDSAGVPIFLRETNELSRKSIVGWHRDLP